MKNRPQIWKWVVIVIGEGFWRKKKKQKEYNYSIISYLEETENHFDTILLHFSHCVWLANKVADHWTDLLAVTTCPIHSHLPVFWCIPSLDTIVTWKLAPHMWVYISVFNVITYEIIMYTLLHSNHSFNCTLFAIYFFLFPVNSKDSRIFLQINLRVITVGSHHFEVIFWASSNGRFIFSRVGNED